MSYGRPKSTLNFVRQGLPFIAIVSGAALFLAQAQKARYDFRQVKKEKETVDKLKSDLAKEGVRVREKETTVDQLYDEVSKIDTEHWENIRGPREYEDNSEYLKARAKQQAEARAKREQKREEFRAILEKSRL